MRKILFFLVLLLTSCATRKTLEESFVECKADTFVGLTRIDCKERFIDKLVVTLNESGDTLRTDRVREAIRDNSKTEYKYIKSVVTQTRKITKVVTVTKKVTPWWNKIVIGLSLISTIAMFLVCLIRGRRR